MNSVYGQLLGGLIGIVIGSALVIGFHWIKQGRWPL